MLGGMLGATTATSTPGSAWLDGPSVPQLMYPSNAKLCLDFSWNVGTISQLVVLCCVEKLC